MKNRLIFLLIFIGFLVILISYFFHKKEIESHVLTLYGNVDVRQVDLGFRVSGKVERLFFEEGDLVKTGDLLALLDKQPYEDLVKQSRATLESVKASLINAQQLLKRRKELIVDGSISQEDLDTAETNYRILEANVAESEAALAVARSNLKFTEMHSPTEGTLLTRIREPGSVLTPGEPVYTLSVTHPVWIRAYVHEQELGLIYPGMKAEIHTDTKNGKVYQGHIGFISPNAEFTPKSVETTQLRTDLVYRLRIYADNSDQGLRQGMPVTVKLNPNEETGG